MKKILALSVCAVLPIMASPVFAQASTSSASGVPSSESATPGTSGTSNASNSKPGQSTTVPSASGSSTATEGQNRSMPAPGTPGAPSGPGATGDRGASATTGAAGASTMGAQSDAASTQAVNGRSVKHDIIGQAVHNGNDEEIGNVEDVVLDANGKASSLVIGAGGFLGMGQHDVAVPFEKVTLADDHLILQGYTKDQLKALPAVKVTRVQ